MSPAVMTATEIAALLRVERETVYELCRRHGLPHWRLGTGLRAPYRFQRQRVVSWLSERAKEHATMQPALGIEHGLQELMATDNFA